MTRRRINCLPMAFSWPVLLVVGRSFLHNSCHALEIGPSTAADQLKSTKAFSQNYARAIQDQHVNSRPLSRINLPLIRNWFQPYHQKFPKVLFIGDHLYGRGNENEAGELKGHPSRSVYERKKYIKIREEMAAKRQAGLDRLLKLTVPLPENPTCLNELAGSIRRHRERRDTAVVSHYTPVDSNMVENYKPSEFGQAMERMIGLTSPTTRSRLQSLWKRLQSLLITTASSSFAGGNSERADELTKALFQQLFKQFDLPAILRRRADKLRRRAGGPSPASTDDNSTEFNGEKVSDDSIRVVDFGNQASKNSDITDTVEPDKTANGGTHGDQQIRQWLGMVTEEDQKLAQNEEIQVDQNLTITDIITASSTTPKPSPTPSTSKNSAMQLQRKKGPVQAAVRLPQKHAKGGIRRFQPVQGKELLDE
ncbi:uncharacterized protein LOC111260325 isoform X1 [Varroa jacobsoni]|uniref:uncharacterized protein LOC111260325 isoform X1 n=1 Tax=Varroa jacobsoni TaxID=62625 RepID=UPI000BF33ACC|nr:uncharacterized protein LOC111260325 isoform X1 [Varroa jacobsoni]